MMRLLTSIWFQKLFLLLLFHKVLTVSSLTIASNNNNHQNSFHMKMHSSSADDNNVNNDNNDVAAAARALNLFRTTPLIKSDPISNMMNGRDVYLKLDCMQSSGSFKDRGMGHLCSTLHERGTKKLISSSGGNAGLAAATVGRELRMEVDVIVPETTKPLVIEKLRSLGAKVQVHGENWNAADLLARTLVEQDPDAAYISPYDNPLLWTGHSTVVDEIFEELPVHPAAIVVSVGGGGLLCGVLEGLQRHGQSSSSSTTAVIAAETIGAASFGLSFEKGEIIRLEKIDSIATSLGALQVTSVALERAIQHQEKDKNLFQTAICTDAEAVDACAQFERDHQLLVEPACGAALAVVYCERIRNMIVDKLSSSSGPIVIEVCGGSGVNYELLSQWKEQFLRSHQ